MSTELHATTDGRDRPRIFVTGSCDGLEKLVESLAAHPDVEFVGHRQQVREGAGALAGGHLSVVLHATPGHELPVDDVAAIREYTRAPIILLASLESATLLEEALDADVADVLLLPQLTENVVFAVRKASHSGRRMQAAIGTTGRVVTVFSPKGGTGKTVTATNLAASLAKQHGKRTLLVDLDLQFGDAAIMLGLEPEKTIHDLVTAPGELDPEKLAGYTARHESGLEILPAPLRPEDAELVTETKLSPLLEVARASFDAIVVDTSPFFHGPMLATLDRTDDLLLLCAMDVPTLKNVRLSLQTLDLLSFPPERVRLVLRRTGTKVGMNPKEVEAALERKVAFEIPADRAVPLAVNRGQPLVLTDPGADFSQAVRAMGKTLMTPAPAKAQRRRLLSLSR